MVLVAAAEHCVDAVSGVIGNAVIAVPEPTVTEFQPLVPDRRFKQTSVGTAVTVIVKFVAAPVAVTVPLSPCVMVGGVPAVTDMVVGTFLPFTRTAFRFAVP